MKSRKGSALLIVLGMLAFMIISAVAFSAYMRYSRLPSSYLRRSSASRQMIKAALARAIDQIDASIGNNPHPGIGTAQTMYPRTGGTYANRNIWLHRVFFGTNQYCSASETIPVLTLEGLAYIPPPLVNDARYYSRLSQAAQWHSLDFDVGRYAYCAIDVSDYFDVNRITANQPRSSAANRRVSLAYLFENDSHTSAGTDGAAWDASFMRKYRTLDDETGEISWAGTVAPLISMADYNLALGAKGGVGGFVSPFFSFIGGTGSTGFYGSLSTNYIGRQTFVTDGLLAKTEETAEGEEDEFDLNDYQPFTSSFLKSANPDLAKLVIKDGGALQDDGEVGWSDSLTGFGCAALYDYLDPDHVPVSLAIPTVERTPMICGMQPVLGAAQMSIVAGESTSDDTASHDGSKVHVESQSGETRVVSKTVLYYLNFNAAAAKVDAMVAYPFNHEADDDGSFKIDGRIGIFLSSEEMGLRTSAKDVIHMADKNLPSSGLDEKGVINIPLRAVGVNFDDATTEEKAVKKVTLLGETGGLSSLNGNPDKALLRIKYQWTQERSSAYPQNVGGVPTAGWGPGVNAALEGGAEVVESHSAIPPLTKGGEVDSNFKDDKIAETINRSSTRVYLNMAVWLRVLDKNGKIVDMVPACYSDDETQLGATGNNIIKVVANQSQIATGKPYPLMRFDTSAGTRGENLSFDFTLTGLEAASGVQEVKIWPEAAYVPDPRFNYAPEHWFASSNFSPSDWLDKNLTGEGDRDNDIFMSTSDAGYLQSKYEFAMLPRLAPFGTYGTNQRHGNMKVPSTSEKSLAQTAPYVNSELMWRTYDPTDFDETEFEKFQLVSGKEGARVNPYSDSASVIMAAFANTPVDWKRASTNDVGEAAAHLDADTAAKFNKEYAWNEYSSASKLAWKDLAALANKFIKAVKTENDWLKAYNGLGWNDDENNFGDISLDSSDDLWGVDRKFLYGFWRECFDARQQLFLVFVRAEPVMMGGGAVGQIPPQLGARAVALVWRSPTGASDPKVPHQTRVLFYRQLD